MAEPVANVIGTPGVTAAATSSAATPAVGDRLKALSDSLLNYGTDIKQQQNIPLTDSDIARIYGIQ